MNSLTMWMVSIDIVQIPAIPQGWDITSLTVFTVLVTLQIWWIANLMKEKKALREDNNKLIEKLDKLQDEVKIEIKKQGT